MDILKNLADLIKVKTIVTFMVMIVFVVMALRGDFTPETVKDIVLMVVVFYFGTQHEKNRAAMAPANTESEANAE